MTDMPTKVRIKEEGPREGVQIETRMIPVEDKLRLIDALGETGLTHIQITSFVSPQAVPAMADADEVAARYTRKPGIEYTAVWLNKRGLLRALETRRIDVKGALALTASEAFLARNQRRTGAEDVEAARDLARFYKAEGIAVDRLGVMAAFGCAFQGEVAVDHVVGLVGQLDQIAKDEGLDVRKATLADTMGWANPRSVKDLCGAVQARFPHLGISLHLHDTRGLGVANAYAGLEMGVAEFDATIGGVGGCPFSGPTAAGNVSTEELAFMCEEMGIDTGLDLEALIAAVKVAEEVFGRSLPGNLSRGGTLDAMRAGARA